MKYTRWLLNTFISLRWSNEEIQKMLTHHSCEIEETTSRTIDPRIVVWLVTEITPHPDAEKLVVCTVDCGEWGTKTICTGATNVQTKKYYPTALDGAVMPAIGLTIGERKMRWIPSQGMLCAKTELGIDEDEHIHGIWDMENDVVVTKDMLGKPVRDLFPWLEGDMFEVDNKTITNRPDLTGHRGIANELYALAKLHDPTKIWLHSIEIYRDLFNQRNVIQALIHGTQSKTQINIHTKGCTSYVLCQFGNITVKPSSMYLRTLLRDAGINPKNNVVDISNLLMVLFGQPTHFFDSSCIEGHIIVRDAKAGEVFVDLTGKEYRLTEDDIVIADEKKILALAWVIGGLSSAITDKTTHITVEIAHFDPIRVRKTAQRHNCRTDASMRFEKNPSPVLPFFVHLALMDLIKIYKDECHDRRYDGHAFSCDPAMADILSSPTQLITTPETIISKISSHDTPHHGEREHSEKWTRSIINSLTALWFSVASKDHTLSIIIPQRRGRADIAIIEDIVEEVARIQWYDNILPQTPSFPMRQAKMDPLIIRKRKAEDHFVQRWNMMHLETYPWIEESYLTPFGYTTQDCIQLQNPVDANAASLRPTILSSLLKACVLNHKRFDEIKIMDIWQIWTKNSQENSDKKEGSSGEWSEQTHVWLLRATKKQPTKFADDCFYHLKEAISQLLDPAYTWVLPIMDKKNPLKGIINRTHNPNPNAHPRQSLIYSTTDQPICELFTIHPSFLAPLKLGNWHVCVAWINLSKATRLSDPLLRNRSHHIATLSDQTISRDLTFVCKKTIASDEIIRAVWSNEHVVDVNIADIYEGKPLADDEKSISITYTIRPEKTLTTEQINNIMNDIITNVWEKGGFLRME